MKTSTYTAAQSTTLQPMHFGALPLDVQTQEPVALFPTFYYLPSRCGIHGFLASYIAHNFKTLLSYTDPPVSHLDGR